MLHPSSETDLIVIAVVNAFASVSLLPNLRTKSYITLVVVVVLIYIAIGKLLQYGA